ncbi:nitroreductase family protein [Nakamurella aerolata]|uniref:nitroreductase family protein n=1 Tax=Nakamurella aerolata TaxID=1656892 RepID=UPI001BB2BC6B
MAWERAPGNDGPQLVDLLHDRWSTRVFDPEHTLDDAQLTTLLEAARWSPSAGNSQPWAFVVGRRGDATHSEFVRHLSRGNAFWAPRASALIVTLHQTASDETNEVLYSDYSSYDLGQAAAHLTVQAMAMGLATHQFAGFDHDAVAEAFAVPPHWQVTTAIAVGKQLPAETVEQIEPTIAARERLPRTRKPLSQFVFGAKFGEPAAWL